MSASDIREFSFCGDPAYRYAHAGYSLLNCAHRTKDKVGEPVWRIGAEGVMRHLGGA
jgi:hypothetical protein